MTKRPFEIRRGTLVDEYASLDGSPVIHWGRPVPGAVPPLSRDERAELLHKLKSSDPKEAERAIQGLEGDRSDEKLEGLLVATANGILTAPYALRPWDDNPRVLSALVDATAHVDQFALSNYAQRLADFGGDEALRVLRLRVRELIDDPRFSEQDYFGKVCWTLTNVLKYLLTLAPDDVQAARHLALVLDHKTGLHRDAVIYAAKFIKDGASPVAAVLRAALEPMLRRGAPDVFFRTAPAFVHTHRDAIERRFMELLDGEDAKVRSEAIKHMAQIDDPQLAIRGRAAMVRELEQGPALEFELFYRVAWLLPDVPDHVIRDIAERGLASEHPTFRGEAIGLLQFLPPEVAAQLARDALEDEPDPRLASKLEDVAAGRPLDPRL